MDEITNMIKNNIIDQNKIMEVLNNTTNYERSIILNKLYKCWNKYYMTIIQFIYYAKNYDLLKEILTKYKDNVNINVKNLDNKTLLYYIINEYDFKFFILINNLYKNLNINLLYTEDNHNLLTILIFDRCMSNKSTIDETKTIIKTLLEKGIKIQYDLLLRLIHRYNYKLKNKILHLHTQTVTYFDDLIDILLEYLYKNNDYDYILEELYNYIIETVNEKIRINEDNKEFYDKIFTIRSNTKSAGKIKI